MGFKYCVVCDTLKFLGYDLLENSQEILEAIKHAGYNGVDIPGLPGKLNTRKLRSILDTLGLQAVEVFGEWPYYQAGENRDLAGPDEEGRKTGIRYAKKSIDLAVEMGAQFFHVVSAPSSPQLYFPEIPIKTLRTNFVESLKEICEYAGGRDISILFEPLNGYEAYPGVLTNVYEAISLIKEIGFDNTGIQPDVYHMNIEESSIADALVTAGKYVRHVHINETNRHSLGTGHGDFKTIIKILKEIEFNGYMAVYAPRVSHEEWQMTSRGYGGTSTLPEQDAATKPDLMIHLERAIKYLKAIEEAIDLQREIYSTRSPYCGKR